MVNSIPLPTLSFPEIPGYRIVEQLYLGSRTAVYRALHKPSQRSVVIKVLRRESPSLAELNQFRNQYAIAQTLFIPGVVRPLSLESFGNSYALVMEDWGGVALDQYVRQQPLDLKTVLAIALQVAEILHDLHQARVIHKDIKPANLLIHPESQQIKLIDFSIATLLPKETPEIKNPNGLEGTLAYLAPEQTGRMNRSIDYRADFYAFGVTLYELLTGVLPFPSTDPLELVHCHLAQLPIPPHQINPALPSVLSALVLKLMAKNAEDRYQSALGLQYDLERCFVQWQETQSIPDFALGQRDMGDRFLIPERLYGRETEVQMLLNAFDRIAAPHKNISGNSRSELVLIAGFSGIGKTAVVNEIHKPVTRQHGYFIQGKFDQLNRNIPFSAFVQAFRNLVRQLLTESNQALANWREKIRAALGENGQVILDVIPELVHIIGSQPTIAELAGSAAQNRFNLLFSQFVRVFTAKEHPLVIFLDDLQWADVASLNLLQFLMADTESGYLLILGAYRDNEVFPAHPLMQTLHHLQSQGTQTHLLQLTPLDPDTITRLVEETLLCPTKIAAPLSQLVYQKTQGNPFFTNQFLKGLQEEGYIQFSRNLRHWTYDLTQVRQVALTDDVVEFMIERLRKLPAATQEVMKLAACIGNRFDLGTLALVCEASPDRVAADLWEGLQEGFVVPEQGGYSVLPTNDRHATLESRTILESHATLENQVSYRFLHDRVQQAAYALIPEAQKQQTHLKIGQLLLQGLSLQEQSEQIFNLVHQLNLGKSAMISPEQKQQLAQLNRQAGQKAKLSAAYQAALSYCAIGIELLPKTAWQDDYDLMYNLYRDGAESAYLCGQFDQAEAMYAIALSHAQTPLDQAVIYRVQMTQYQLQGRNAEAIIIQRDSLKILGWTLPQTPEEIQASLDEQIQLVNQYLAQHSIESILTLPKMQDDRIAEILRILQILLYAAWLDGQTTLALLAVAKMTTLSLQYGNSDMSPFGYVGYGLVANAILQDAAIAYQFGSTAVKLCDQFDNADVQSMTNFLFAADVHSWSRPLQEADPYYNNAYQYGMEAGNWLTVSFMMMQSGSDRLTYGKKLEELDAIAKGHADFLRRIKSLENLDALTAGVVQPIRHLLGLTKTLNSFDDDSFNEAEYLEKYRQNPYCLAWLYSVKIRHAYLFGQIETYVDLIPHLSIIEQVVPTHSKVPSTVFYVILMHLSLWENTQDEAQRQFHWQAILPLETQLQQWQQACPANLYHKCLLIQAEKARLDGQYAEAADYYEEAIAQAQTQGYLYEAALANERAAKFYRDWNKEKIATLYLQAAHQGYAHWGAKAKVAQLEQTHPQLFLAAVHTGSFVPSNELTTFSQNTITADLSLSSFNSTAAQNLWLDLPAIMKAAQAISQEMELEKLLATLVKIAIVNAGAQVGYFILNQADQWVVVAQADPTQAKTLQLSFDQCQKIPQSLIYSVARTQETAVFENLSTVSQFAADPYVVNHRPKSVLCTPVSQQGKLIGILYLENSVAIGAFTKDRIEILQLLASQAAISLENARLYQQTESYSRSLEAEVARKTESLNQKVQDLEQTLKKLQQAQAQLVQSEKMSSLGQLVAGVAHEINNPVNFIHGNVNHLAQYMQDLLGLLQAYQQHYPEPHPAVQDLVT
nr:AAA family ATPase [Oculatellaceae cyanobacterium Prado106]